MTNQEIANRTTAALQELFTVWGGCPATGGSREARAAGERAQKALALVAEAAVDRDVANCRFHARLVANSPW